MVDATWPVAAVLFVAGVTTGLLAVVGWRVEEVVAADWFAAMMATNTLWIATDLGGLFVDSYRVVVLRDAVTTGTATLVPALWFCFLLEYTGRDRLLDRRGLALVWATPAVVLLALVTSPLHDLYYESFAYSTTALGLVVDSRPGPVAWLNLSYFAVVVVLGVGLVGRALVEHDRLHSRQASWLLVGGLAPVALFAASFLREFPDGFPTISLGFSVLGIAYAHSLFTHRLLELSPAVRRIGVPEAFDDLGEGVVVVGVEYDVVAINDRACELFDCRKGTVQGAPLERVSERLAAAARDGTDEEFRSDGRVLAASTSTVRSARDRATGHALVVRDVTGRRRQQQRLDVLNRVFRHNIRNEMNAVVGPAAVLAERLDGADAGSAETARDAGEAVLDLAESARAVEEMMTGDLEPTDVDVDDLVESVAASVRDDHAFSLDATVPAATVHTDPGILSVVLENVLENAVEHDGAPEPAVRLAVERRDGGCLVSVTDEGPGVPPEELDVLRAGGETALDHASGLGLWAIRWGANRLDGAVRFDDLDDGTRVLLWAPDLTGDRAAPPPDDTPTGETGSWFGRDDPALASGLASTTSTTTANASAQTRDSW